MDAQASQALLDSVQREAFCSKKKETRTIFIGEPRPKNSLRPCPVLLPPDFPPLRDAKRPRKSQQLLAL